MNQWFSGSGAVGLAHLDGSCTEECVMSMVHKVQGLSVGVQGRLELHMVGGFSDLHNYSEDLFFGIMRKYAPRRVVDAQLTSQLC